MVLIDPERQTVAIVAGVSFPRGILSERGQMRAWLLFAILAFLVFGVPLIDELYKMRLRRRAGSIKVISDQSVSLVPDVTREDLLGSDENVANVVEEV